MRRLRSPRSDGGASALLPEERRRRVSRGRLGHPSRRGLRPLRGERGLWWLRFRGERGLWGLRFREERGLRLLGLLREQAGRRAPDLPNGVVNGSDVMPRSERCERAQPDRCCERSRGRSAWAPASSTAASTTPAAASSSSLGLPRTNRTAAPSRSTGASASAAAASFRSSFTGGCSRASSAAARSACRAGCEAPS